MKEVMVYDNKELIASVFIDEEGNTKAIVADGYKVSVNGRELEK